MAAERGCEGACPGWSGGVVEGDLLAGEVFELADQLPGSRWGCRRSWQVGAEVDEAGIRIREQVVGDGEDLVANGDQGAFGASSLARSAGSGRPGEGRGPGSLKGTETHDRRRSQRVS
jgi:hypothetical protein